MHAIKGTLKNYWKAIRIFCEMSEIELPWKRITGGLPRPKRYAQYYELHLAILVSDYR